MINGDGEKRIIVFCKTCIELHIESCTFSMLHNCQALAQNPKTPNQGPWADTKISWATYMFSNKILGGQREEGHGVVHHVQ